MTISGLNRAVLSNEEAHQRQIDKGVLLDIRIPEGHSIVVELITKDGDIVSWTDLQLVTGFQGRVFLSRFAASADAPSGLVRLTDTPSSPVVTAAGSEASATSSSAKTTTTFPTTPSNSYPEDPEYDPYTGHFERCGDAF